MANNIGQLNRCENKKLPKQKDGRVKLLFIDYGVFTGLRARMEVEDLYDSMQGGSASY